MKIQYKENEIKNLILNNDFVEIPFDFTNLKSKTLKIEAIVFERKIKFELMYINKKYDFLFDSIENVVFQILIPKNKKSLKDKSFSLENIENYGFFLFKEVKNG